MKTKRTAGTLTALAPWFGSKRQLAGRIVEALGPHHAYYEPFCGSMAVLFAKPPCRHEVVNDLNRDLVNVAAVIQSRPLAAELLGRLHFTLFSEDLHKESRRVLAEAYAGPLGDVDRAYHALRYWWMGRNGCAGTRRRTTFCARFSAKGGGGAARWRGLVGSVPLFAERLQRVEVLNRDAFDLLSKVHDAAGTVVYVDPPYFVKSEPYEHDLDVEGHRRLAEALSRFAEARVVLSYYPHPLIDSLYPHDRWHHLPVLVAKTMSRTSKLADGARVKATELLITNRRPADAAPDLFGAAS